MVARPQKIAFIGGRGLTSNYGGVENAIRSLTEEITGICDCEVYVTGHGESSWFTKTAVNDRLVDLRAPKSATRLGHAITCVFLLFYTLVVIRPKVIFFFASGPCALSVFARLFGVKSISCLRAIDSQRDKWGALNRWILRLGEFSATRFSHACTVNSLEMKRYFAKKNIDTCYIPNGISHNSTVHPELLEELNLEPDGFILFAGRLDPVKRLHVLLEAYALIPQEKRIPLIVAGGHSKSEKYTEQLHALAIPGVRFIGHVGNPLMATLMNSCAIFVLPSVLEGMSNSLLSAMGAGRCVICADIPENADVVRNSSDALFERDDPRALAAKLERYIDDTQERDRIGKDLQQWASENFNWTRSAEQFLEFTK